ncbi:hypothetical protein E2I00_018137, partial [Balaenoptera physalus]
VTVSSGGMLVQKLSTDDLQSERTAFDGTMVYAQNKVSEGFLKAATWVLFQRWARAHPAIHFSCMHPGWVDTPDRKPVPTHLPLARTSSSPAEEEKLIEILEELAQRFK